MNKKRFLQAALMAIIIPASAFATVATGSGYVSQTTASVSIAPRDNLIVATTTINWDTRASDRLAVDWVAPQGSYCKNSQFIISRGSNVTGDVSWAYRTISHAGSNGQQIVCSGRWIANVVNIDSNTVLASAGYTVPAALANS